jgi:N-6 DNA methylase
VEQLDLFASADEPEIPATFAAHAAPSRVVPARPANPSKAAPAPDALFADPRPALPAIQTRTPAHLRSIASLTRNPRDAGRQLGEAVADVWNSSSHGGYRMDIPVSIVAALALFPAKGYTEDVTRIITTCTDWQLIQGYREIYTSVWSRRPDLAARMAPLLAWLTEDNHKDLIYPVRRVTETAIRYGVLELTGSPDPEARSDTDLMSWTITSLRSHGARQGLGEYHTPPEICDMMARITIGDEPPPKGLWFNDPAGGTGGMFRATAQHLRNLHLDPADYVWALTDIDPLAAAGAAVNAIVWGLGPNVLISCGNSLSEGDLTDRAIQERNKLIEERDQIVGYIAAVEAYNDAMALVDRFMVGEKAS